MQKHNVKPLINLDALFSGVHDAYVPGHDVETSAAPSHPQKDVLIAWAKSAYEADNLPQGAKVVFGINNKITLSLGDKCVIFYSNKPRVTTKIVPKPVAVAKPTKVEPTSVVVSDGSRTCKNKSCGKKFVPASDKFVHCPACYAEWVKQVFGVVAKPAPEPVNDGSCTCKGCKTRFIPVNPKFTHCPDCYKQYVLTTFGTLPKVAPAPKPAPQMDAKKLFEGFARDSFEANTLPEGAKVTVLGSQVSVTALGFSTTFHSERLANKLKADKIAAELENQRRLAAERQAQAIKRAAEAKAKASEPVEDKKSKKGKKGGEKVDAKSNKKGRK
jgi:hypothetical protein